MVVIAYLRVCTVSVTITRMYTYLRRLSNNYLISLQIRHKFWLSRVSGGKKHWLRTDKCGYTSFFFLTLLLISHISFFNSPSPSCFVMFSKAWLPKNTHFSSNFPPWACAWADGTICQPAWLRHCLIANTVSNMQALKMPLGHKGGEEEGIIGAQGIWQTPNTLVVNCFFSPDAEQPYCKQHYLTFKMVLFKSFFGGRHLYEISIFSSLAGKAQRSENYILGFLKKW